MSHSAGTPKHRFLTLERRGSSKLLESCDAKTFRESHGMLLPGLRVQLIELAATYGPDLRCVKGTAAPSRLRLPPRK